MPKVSEAYLTERQNHILDAAVRCFAANGFHATGMADLIRESGLSAGSVYRYYRSKDDLIASIIERLLDGLYAQLVEASKRVDTMPAMVAGAVDIAERTFSGPESDYARLLPQVWTEALRNPAVATTVREAYGRIFDMLEDLIVRLQTDRRLPADLDPRGAGHVLFALVQGYMLQRLMVGADLDPGRYLAAVHGLLLKSGS